MRLHWTRIEEIWNESRSVAVLLILSGLALVSWTFFQPQSPGVSIGLLALVAGIMSIRPNMHPVEKLTWVFILIAFTILEVRSIKRSDEENKTIRDAQNARFSEIAQGLKDSIEIGKTQYQDTLGHVNSVMETTQIAANTARKGVDNLTGTNSYLDIFPIGQNGSFILVTVVLGNNIVWDAQVNLRDGGYVDSAFYTTPITKIQLKPVPVNSMVPLGYAINPSIERDNQYGFKVDSRGTMSIEDLTIRYNKKTNVWEYDTWISSAAPPSKQIPTSNRLIKHFDWRPILEPIMVGGVGDHKHQH